MCKERLVLPILTGDRDDYLVGLTTAAVMNGSSQLIFHEDKLRGLYLNLGASEITRVEV